MHPLAGKPAPEESLIDVTKLERAYFERKPDVADVNQLVAFGTSGHRGTPFDGTFTESHIIAIAQAISEYRQTKGIDGPLFMGKDTHAASAPAERTALEVLAANGVTVVIQENDGFTPTPVISHAILQWNKQGKKGIADGIVITPSHNPPSDGGFKYNPPHGGPADTDVTGWIQNRANELIRNGCGAVKRISFEAALKKGTTRQVDFVGPYVDDLGAVIDMDVIKRSGIRVGVDPLGGASTHYWDRVRERYGIDLTVVSKEIDPTFKFMTLDHDGKIRMDCSSKHAMQRLVHLQKAFDIAFGNDPDADRHGIVTPSHGLMDPNHFLAVAIHFLHIHRPAWPLSAIVGKTVVSSSMIDRVVQSIGRPMAEVPVGFKWFADGLHKGTYCFGGEESAGASFLRKDGSAWSTDKDGLILGLLSAEITARCRLDPAEYYHHLSALLGRSYYRREDTKATPEQKKSLKSVTPEAVKIRELAGEPVIAKLTHVGGASIGGIKVTSENGWFAARPSGTENIVKIYAESFRSEEGLQSIIEEARKLVLDLTS